MHSCRTERCDYPPAEIAAEAGFGKIVVFLEVDYTAVELDDVVFRRRSLPRREVFAEGVEEKSIAPRTDSVLAEQKNLTFRRLKSTRRDGSTEQDMNCVSVSANYINGDSTASEPYDHLCCRRRLPPNRVIAEVVGSVYKHRKFFRRPDPTPVDFATGRNGGYIRTVDCAVSMQRTSDGVTSSRME